MPLAITDVMATGTPRSSQSLFYFSLLYSWIGKFGRSKVELSLTRSSSVQALATILTARWAFNGKVNEGSYCTAQGESLQLRDGCGTLLKYLSIEGVLKSIGNDGVCASWIRVFRYRVLDGCLSIIAWFTIAIAVMTFVQTMFPGMLNQSQVRQLAVAMIVFIFLFLLLMITIPATTIPHYYGDTG
jgi:hypothetical protein